MGTTIELEVLSPRAEIKDSPRVSASPRLGSLSGKKIGVLKNSKPGADMLIPYIRRAIEARIPGVEFREWVVPHADVASVKEPRLKEITAYADGVIALMGD